MSDSPILYLSDNLVADVKLTKAPFHPTRTGGKVPSQYMIYHATGKRWHRVYFMVYSNSASAYIERLGTTYFLTPETEERLEALRES